jgi:hypothetical protein
MGGGLSFAILCAASLIPAIATSHRTNVGSSGVLMISVCRKGENENRKQKGKDQTHDEVQMSEQ